MRDHVARRAFRGASGAGEQTPIEQKKQFETFKAQGGQIVDKVKELIREGNVRRIAIKQEDHVAVECLLTVGVRGAAAALFTDCTIEVERETPTTAEEQDNFATATAEVG